MALLTQFPPKPAKALVRLYQREINGTPRYELVWRAEGKRQRRMLSDLRTAEAESAILAKNLATHSGRSHVVSPPDFALLQKAKRLGEPAIDEALRKQSDVRQAITVSDFAPTFLSIYGHRAQRTEKDVRSRMNTILASFGHRSLRSLTTSELETWYLDLPGAIRNKNNILAVLVTFLNAARDREYLPNDRKTPAERVRKIRPNKKDPEILSILQATKVLRHARPDLIPYLALGMFAGLRPSEAAGVAGERPGILWSDIDIEARTIRIRRQIAGKKHRPRLIEPPEAIFDWLRWAHTKLPPEQLTGPMCYRKSQQIWCKQNRENDLAWPWPQDGARHSFISYHLGIDPSVDKTARMAGNSPQVILESYDNPRSEADGRAWFALTPLAIGRP